MRIYLTAVFLVLFSAFHLHAQTENGEGEKPASSDSSYEFLLKNLENQDIAFLWGGEISSRNRIGFIGEEFQRLSVEFISVIQNFDNPWEYFIYGTSRVKENVCSFQGSLQITETGILKNEKHNEFTRAYLKGDYVLYEDQSCMHSGIFSGDFITSVYLDESGQVYYDNLDQESQPKYRNNEFFGKWQSYTDAEELEAHWGDFRIPFSIGLDVGKERFKPAFQYREQGWKEYADEKQKEE